MLVSASVHESEAANPPATTTARRVDCLYDLMVSACGAPETRAHSEQLGRAPPIAVNPRRNMGLRTELAASAARSSD